MAKSVQYQNPYLIDLLVCLVKKKVGATDELSKNHFDKIGEASASVDSVKHFFTDKHLISGDTNINTYYFATKKTLNKYCEYIGEVDWKTFCNAEKENSLSFEPNLSTKSTTTHEARLRYYKYYEKHKANIQIAIQSHEKIQIARKREYEIPQIEVKTNGLKLLKKLDKIQETLTTHPPINFDLIARHRQLTRDIKQLNQEFEEIRQKKEKIEKTIANKTDEEVIELLTDQVQELGVKLLLIDGQRSTQQKELLQLEENAKRFFIFINNDVESKDAVLLKVREFINNGNWKEIEALLNSSDLQEEEEAIKNDAEHKYQALSEKLLAKAQLTHINKTNPNWFAEAHTYYQKAVSLHESYGTCYSFAFFLREHNQHDEAIHYCQKALNLDADSGQTAKVLNNLAALHYAKNEIVEAEEEFQKALGIFRKLSLLNPQVYEPDVAMTLNGLAALHYAKNEIVEAEKEFQEAIRIFRKLAILNPQVYERMVAMALNNLANLHYAKNEIAEAEQAYREALEICRKLAILNPQVYERMVAMTLKGLAALHYAKNEIAEAEESYREAIGLFRKLGLLNPQVYEPKVAMTLNGLANLHHNKNEIVEAEQAYREALGIFRKLSLLNPQVYEPDVATTLYSLADLHRAKNEIVEAEEKFKEALKMYRKLAVLNPQVYERMVAMTLNNLANLYYAKNEIAEAEQAYREALEICRKLAILNPQVYEPKVAGTLNNLAALYYAKNEIVEAEQAYREALSIRRKLAILNIHIYESDVAMTLNGLAILHIDRNEIVEAEEEFQEALEIYRKLGLLNPQEYDALVAMTLNNLANLYSTKNEIVEAEQAYREALEIHLVLAKRNPSIYQLPLATALINFSYFCLLQNDKYSSLHSSFEAYKNAIIYVQYVPKALEIVHDAIQAWAAWGEDLSKYLEDKNDEDG